MAEVYHELHAGKHKVSISKEISQNSQATAICTLDKRENKLSPFGSGSDQSSQDAGGFSSPGTNAMCSMSLHGRAREGKKMNRVTGGILNSIGQRAVKYNLCS